MKKYISLVLFLIIIFSSLIGCNSGTQNSGEMSLKIVTPDGAPSLSLAKLMYDNDTLGAKSVNYNVVSSSTISSYVIRKDGDAIILPLNVATKIAEDNYQMAGVVTHGNLYIVSSVAVNSLNDLKGKRVGAIGQGQVPDLTMKAILSANGISYQNYSSGISLDADKVYFDYYTGGSMLIPVLKSNIINIGILPEPAVTNLKNKAPNYSVKLNVQELYDATEKSYPQAVLLVKRDLIINNKDVVINLITAINNNESWLKNNVSLAIDTINAHLDEGVVASFTNTLGLETINNCNVKFVSAKESKSSVLNYINKIQGIDSKAISNVNDTFFLEI